MTDQINQPGAGAPLSPQPGSASDPSNTGEVDHDPLHDQIHAYRKAKGWYCPLCETEPVKPPEPEVRHWERVGWTKEAWDSFSWACSHMDIASRSPRIKARLDQVPLRSCL